MGYVLIHLLNLGVPSDLPSKTFNWYSTSIGTICKLPSNWYMQGKQFIPPEVQDLLGDLILKGEKSGSKQGMFPTKRERCSQEKKHSKGGDMLIESSHEGEVAR